MFERHRHYLQRSGGAPLQSATPAPNVTHVPNGDLWEMVRFALSDLVDFSNDLNIAELA